MTQLEGMEGKLVTYDYGNRQVEGLVVKTSENSYHLAVLDADKWYRPQTYSLYTALPHGRVLSVKNAPELDLTDSTRTEMTFDLPGHLSAQNIEEGLSSDFPGPYPKSFTDNGDGTLTVSVVASAKGIDYYHYLGHQLEVSEAVVKIYNHETGELLEVL